MKFDSEAANYYFKITMNLLDDEEKIALLVYFEIMFFQYVERNQKKRMTYQIKWI